MDKKHKEILEIVKNELSCSAHNLDHVLRVYNICMMIAKHEEDVDLEVLIPAALLHDIARVKESQDKTGEIDHAVLGSEMSVDILRDLNYEEDKVNKIKHCITTHRFRSGNEPKTIEAKILFDADKLDAIGAIGIVRSFMLAGQFGQALWSNESLNENMSNNTSDNGRLKDVSKHSPFIEYQVKLKKIPDRLFTMSAKEIGIQRLEFMEQFFRRLELEAEGIQ